MPATGVPAPADDYERTHGKPRPDMRHSLAQTNLIAALAPYQQNPYTIFSELTIKLGAQQKTTPDLSIYPQMEIDYTRDEPFLTDPPLTTIHIPSGQDREPPLEETIRRMRRGGVECCWLGRPKPQTIMLFTDEGARTVREGTVTDPATGIEVALEEVFQGMKA